MFGTHPLSCQFTQVDACILCHLEESADGDAFPATPQKTGILLVALLLFVLRIHSAQLVEKLSAPLTQPIGKGKAKVYPVVIGCGDIDTARNKFPGYGRHLIIRIVGGSRGVHHLG